MVKKTLFHGAPKICAGSIVAKGLMSTNTGRLGPGLYLTDDRHVASAAATRKTGFNKTTQYVVVVEAELGKIKDYGSGVDVAGSWANQDYNSATSMHPPWPQPLVKKPFREYCVKNSQGQVTVKGAQIVHPDLLPEDKQTGIPYYIRETATLHFLDCHGNMKWKGQDLRHQGLNYSDVGTHCTNIQWVLESVGSHYLIKNVACGKYLTAFKVGKNQKVRAERNTKAHGKYALWDIKQSRGGINNYFIVNVGQQKYLDSNGMGLWVSSKGLKDHGINRMQIQWKFIRA